MENHLNDINAVLGVVGSFVCLSDGSLVAKALPDKFDAASVEVAARLAAQTLNALEVSGQRVVDADLVYGQGRLVLKNLRAGILVIVCARNINIPLLNLTANVVTKKIAPELRAPKAASAAGVPPTSATIELPPSPPVAAETPGPMLEVASDSTIPPSESVNGNFLNELIRELNRMIGPAGSVVVEDEIDALKETRDRFPKSRAAELVERVSLVIHDGSKRARFKQVMSESVRKL